MDTFPKPSSRIGRLILLGACLAGSAGGEPRIPFAEDIFPEVRELIELAAGASTELQASQWRVEERSGDLEAARGQRRPQANLYARLLAAYETRDDIDDTFRGNVNANLTVTQPLYRWGNLLRQQEIAAHRVELETVELQRVGAEQFMQVRRAYLQWILMRERREILQQSIALSASFVEARRQLVEAGQRSEQDVLEMEARLLENHESLAWVENSLVDLEHSLRRLAGRGLRVEDLAGGPISAIQPLSPDELEGLKAFVQSRVGEISDPMEDRFALLETIEDKQLASLDKRHWPAFDLVAGVLSDRLDAVNIDDSVIRVQYYAGLQVSWNLFDGWQTKAHKRSALARKRGFALYRDQADENTRRTADSLLAALQLNLKQMEARGKRESLLERRVSLLREQAERDLITGTERLEGEIDYLEVRQRLMEARVNYLINLMQLGILLDQDPAAPYYTPDP